MEEEKQIYIPEPEGYRRANLVFKNGVSLAIDEEPEELVRKLERFAASDDRFLMLSDPSYAATIALTHAGLDDVMWVGVTWLKTVAARPSKIVVAPAFGKSH